MIDRRAETCIDELKTRRAALAQADPQFQERAHGNAIVPPRRPSFVHGDCKRQTAMTVAQIATMMLAFIELASS